MNDAMSINVDGSPGLMGRVGQKLCAAKERANKAVCLLDARMRLLTASRRRARSPPNTRWCWWRPRHSPRF